MLPDVTGPDHLIDGPPRRVGVSLKVSVCHVAVGDVAVHSHIGYRSIRAVLEALPLRPAGIVFAPVAVALPVLALFHLIFPGGAAFKKTGALIGVVLAAAVICADCLALAPSIRFNLLVGAGLWRWALGASFGGPGIVAKVSRIKHGGSLTARPYVMLLRLSGLFFRRLLWRLADLRPASMRVFLGQLRPRLFLARLRNLPVDGAIHEVIGHLLRVSRRSMNLMRVFFKHLHPILDIGRSALRVMAHAHALPGHHGADLGPQFFAGVFRRSEAFF